MRRPSFVFGLLIISFLLGACAAPLQGEAFSANRKNFVARVDTIALLPVDFVDVPEAPEPFKQRVEELIKSEVEAAGFVSNHGADT